MLYLHTPSDTNPITTPPPPHDMTGVALNCKISALALVPFLFAWSLLQRLVYHFSQIGANLWAVAVWEVPLGPLSVLGGLGLWKKPPVLSLRV